MFELLGEFKVIPGLYDDLNLGPVSGQLTIMNNSALASFQTAIIGRNASGTQTVITEISNVSGSGVAFGGSEPSEGLMVWVYLNGKDLHIKNKRTGNHCSVVYRIL